MTSQPSQEVQLLLAAEKRASEKVAEARKRKAQLMKKAKEEAAADIEQFKAERQLSFNKYETEHIGSKDDIAKKIESDTAHRLETMHKCIGSNKPMLLRNVMDTIIDSVRDWTYPPPKIRF